MFDRISHNVPLLITTGLVISFVVPPVGILLSPFVPALFMILMFFSTLSISFSRALFEIEHPRKTLTVLFLVHILTPLFVLLTRPFLQEDVFLGLVLLACTPAGISSLFLSKLFKGDPSRALVVIGISSLFSPITVPLLVLLFGRTTIQIDTLSMITTIVKLIIIPMLCARLCAHSHYKEKLEKAGSSLNVFVFLLIVIGSISPTLSTLLSDLGTTSIVAGIIFIQCAVFFLLGFSVGDTLESKISYGLSAYFKNFALSMVLSLTLFTTYVALPSIVYALVGSFILIPIQWFIEGKRKAHS